MARTTRRDFLLGTASLIGTPLIAPSIIRAASFDNDFFQSQWRYCDKCAVLFFNGFPAKGTCSAGGAHNAYGFEFELPHGNQLVETEKAQANWRYCGKCFSMFYDGFPDKAKCAAGGGHAAQGFKFRLPHDIADDGKNQTEWRYCQKCHVMFYNGFPGKGRCAAGGAHSAYGYVFVLPHGNPPDLSIRTNVTTSGWAPIGGWLQVDVHSSGDFSFAGHIHNSGAVNIRYTLAAVLITPSGQSFGFARNAHRVDGTQTLIDRNRDDNWNSNGNDIDIMRNWDQVSRAQLQYRLVAADTITTGIEKYLFDFTVETFQKLTQAATSHPLTKFYMKLLQTI